MLKICMRRSLIISASVKPYAHGDNFAEQSSIKDIMLSEVFIVCGQIFLRKLSFVALRRISSMFIDFCHK